MKVETEDRDGSVYKTIPGTDVVLYSEHNSYVTIECEKCNKLIGYYGISADYWPTVWCVDCKDKKANNDDVVELKRRWKKYLEKA